MQSDDGVVDGEATLLQQCQQGAGGSRWLVVTAWTPPTSHVLPAQYEVADAGGLSRICKNHGLRGDGNSGSVVVSLCVDRMRARLENPPEARLLPPPLEQVVFPFIHTARRRTAPHRTGVPAATSAGKFQEGRDPGAVRLRGPRHPLGADGMARE